MQFTTLVDYLNASKSLDRHITYIEGAGEEKQLSFGELHHRAIGLLHHLQRKGIQKGDELILLLDSNEQFIDIFWACLLGGIIPVPLATGTSDEQRHKLIRILHNLRNPYLYTNSNVWTRYRNFVEQHYDEQVYKQLRKNRMLTESIEDIDVAGSPADIHSEDIAFVQYSSGSTSEPKGVVLTHANILATIRDMSDSSAFTDKDISLSWMPLTHDMGLIGFHLNMLVAGMNQYLMETEVFVRRPLLWMRYVSDTKANILCSPNFGYRHFLKAFKPEKMLGTDLSHVRILYNGAEPISDELSTEFLSTMAQYGLKDTTMRPAYGLAEASLGVAFPELGKKYETLSIDRSSLGIGDKVIPTNGENSIRFVSVGQPLGKCKVKLLDDVKTEVGEDQIGHILIKGPNVTQGFYKLGNIDSNSHNQDGWLDTGDLGFYNNDRLFVTGRSKDVIFLNGQNYYAHDLENVAIQIPDLDLGKVVVSSIRNPQSEVDIMVLFIQHRGELTDFLDLANRTLRHINEQTGADIVEVVPVNRIPKTTSGKVQRFLLARDYNNGIFADVLRQIGELKRQLAEQTENLRSETEKTLAIICHQVLNLHVAPQDNFFEIGADSLKLADISELIDTEFPGCVEAGDFVDHPTLSAMAQLIDQKQSSGI